MRLIDGDVANFCDDVILPQARFIGWAARFHLSDVDTPFCSKVIALSNVRGDGLETDPHIRASKVSLLDDLLGDGLCRVHWNSETKPFCHVTHAAVANDKRINSD